MNFLRVTRVFSLIALAFALCFAKPAYAGDAAERSILGFSPDGRYFAFEQYGVQDGSGFPYSDIFVIDTSTDQWVENSPFRILLKDERVQLKQARKEAITKAANLLKKLVIAQPGRLLASNPSAELSAEPHHVVVNTSRIIAGQPERWTFTLEEKVHENAQCASYTSSPIKGFRLSVQRTGGAVIALHEDASIPKSRRCPLRYAIHDIITHEPNSGARIFAVLVSVYALGFEGPDRRFLAVTLRLP
jgi:predicted secreted protein